MSITSHGIGFGVAIGQFELAVYVDELFLRIPRVFEFAWSRNGLYLDRI